MDDETRYRNVLMWTLDRLGVDGGMTAKEIRRTRLEIGRVLLGKPSFAARYQPSQTTLAGLLREKMIAARNFIAINEPQHADRHLRDALSPTETERVMGELVHHECHDLICALDRIGSSVRYPPCHWISTPDGGLGTEWCPTCGYYKVRNLRRRDRRRRGDYLLDGGWYTEHDGPVHCAACGCRLDGALTTYGAMEELEYFRDAALRPGNPEDAYDLASVLMGLEYTSKQDAWAAEEAKALARSFLTKTASPERTDGDE